MTEAGDSTMLPDFLAPQLTAVFVGSSVATASATRGHYYAGRGNKFWQLLWEAGLTGGRLLVPDQDFRVVQYGIGLTDLVKGMATSSDSLLRSSDYDIPGFLAKIEKYEPFAVAFNGVEAARRVFRYLGKGEPALGKATARVRDAYVFVLPSSSGANADRRNFLPKESKSAWWCEFGAWLRERRKMPFQAP